MLPGVARAAGPLTAKEAVITNGTCSVQSFARSVDGKQITLLAPDANRDAEEKKALSYGMEEVSATETQP